MKLWIVGSEGLVGGELVRQCQARKMAAVGTGHQDVDICQLSQVLNFAHQHRPTHIVNAAAYIDVDGAESQKQLAFSVNAEGAENVAKAAKQIGAHLLHISTDYVFDGKSARPYKEADSCAPLNVYGKSKWEGEKRVLAEYPASGIVRTSWVFGKKAKRLIFAPFLRLFKEKQVKAVTDQVGKPTYCPDLVQALLSLLDVKGIVHFANEGEMSRYQIACHLLTLAKERGLPVLCEGVLPVDSTLFPGLAPRPHYSALDTSKYTQLTSKKPRHWLEAAKELIDEGF